MNDPMLPQPEPEINGREPLSPAFQRSIREELMRKGVSGEKLDADVVLTCQVMALAGPAVVGLMLSDFVLMTDEELAS